MDGTIDPRAQSCDATMTLSPIDKLRCPVGDNEKWERNIYSPVLNIIRQIYFIISLLRFIIHHIYYGAASPIWLK